MTLYKHRNARDVAVRFIRMEKTYCLVEFWNINYTKISGKAPLYLGVQEIPRERINKADYSKWEYHDAD